VAKLVKRQCPGPCGQVKEFREDQKTCGCGGNHPVALKEANVIEDNHWTLALPKTRIHTLDQLVKFFEIDLSIWEVKKFTANKWDMGYVVNGRASQHELYQVKAFLEKKKEIADARKEIERLKELAKKQSAKPVPVRELFGKIDPKYAKQCSSGNMLELNFADHHFGKLAWATETGHANYDTKIAGEVFDRALNAMLLRANNYRYDEVWFVVGNDLLNSDDTEGRTTKGTYVSTDIRYHKTFDFVRNKIIGAIEKLRTYAPKVKVIMVSGNHDRLSVWHLGDSLECYFHKYKDVVIDNSPKYYKYHEFGKVMILYTHGDKGKRLDYPLLMATDQPKMFGRTLFREAHTGHNHYDRVMEQHGVKVRIMPSLSPDDAWHAENAFVGNLRSSQAFQWNAEQGLVGTVIYTDKDDLIEAASEIKVAA